MNIDTAQNAGVLAQKIVAVQGKLDAMTAARDSGWLLKSFTFIAPDESTSISPLDSPLDAKMSAPAIDMAISIYQAELHALNTQLSAL